MTRSKSRKFFESQLLLLFFKLIYSCFTVLCQFLLYSKAYQPQAHTHPCFLGFPSHLGHYRALSRFPSATQQILIQFSSVAQSCPTLCNPRDYSTPGFPVHHQLPELTQTPVHRVDDAIQPSRALSSPSPPTSNLSQHQDLFQRVSSLNQGPNYWSFTFSISPSNKYSGLISFRMNWLDLLVAQETLKSLLQPPQFKSINSSALSFLYSLTLTTHT